MQTDSKMQTADCRPEVKCRPRKYREILVRIAKIVAIIAMIVTRSYQQRAIAKLNNNINK